MKKIFLLFLLIFAVGCENPFDKYKKSVDDVQKAIASAQTIKTEIDKITPLLDESVTNADISTIFVSLQEINNNLSGAVIQSIVSSFAEQYNINLDKQMDDIKASMDTALENYTPVGDQPSKAEVEALLTSILGKL